MTFKTRIRFSAMKPGLILEYEAEKCAYLIEHHARKPLAVVSTSQRSES
jgi:hypothetical protein